MRPSLSLLAPLFVLAACSDGGDSATEPGADGDVPIDAGADGSDTRGGEAAIDAPPSTGESVTAKPTPIDDILYNPGMGFEDFHFGWGKPPPESQYPKTRVAYLRWTWEELEPAEGAYAFKVVDDAIATAKSKNETLAFRIMPQPIPAWLQAKGLPNVNATEKFPDHNHPIFLALMEKMIKAFGEKYAGSADIDHVDIGSVGCWGEWNTACCGADSATCDKYFPTEANQSRIGDWYFTYFPRTPLTALAAGAKIVSPKGAGWRADCYGDYGIFGSTWNHMENYYPDVVADPGVKDAWKKAPVAFEVCGVMQDWYDKGFDIDLILAKGLEWHMTVLNGKSSPVPAAWRPKVDAFLKKVGYRFVLQQVTHTGSAAPGESIHITSEWTNAGVTPVYHPWPLAYRLRAADDGVAAQWSSAIDLRTWLPGAQKADDVVAIPATVKPGTYALDVAILSADGKKAYVELAIAGKRTDLWYPVSSVKIR